MPEVRFRYGDVSATIPYTPSGADVVAGQVVVIGDLVGIATRLIPNGVMGGLNVEGGVYQATGNGVIAAGTVVYWDNVSGKVTATAGALKKLGKLVTACPGDNALCEFLHNSAVS